MIYYTEQTLLNPRLTEIRMEGWLIDTTNIQTPNRYGEFSFSFQPQTTTDLQRLYEVLEGAKTTILMDCGRHSNKTPVSKVEDKFGHLVCSQLFQPKVNLDFYHPDELMGREATFALHLRDNPQGDIFLQGDYVDVFSPTNGIDEPTSIEEEVFDDW